MLQAIPDRVRTPRPYVRRRFKETLAPTRVILAEDDSEMRQWVAGALRKDGYVVFEVINGTDLETRARSKWLNADVIVSDIRMPGRSGLDALATLRKHDWATPVIMITAFGDEETIAEAKRMGAATVLSKPFDIGELRHAVRNVAPPLI